MVDSGTSKKRASDGTLRGAIAGALVGLVDALDTIAGGFTANLPVADNASVLLVMICLNAAAGVLIGTVVAAAVRIPLLRRAWPPPHLLAAGLALGLGAITGVLAWGLRMLLVVSPWIVVVVAAVAGLAIAIAALRFRDRPRLALVLWLVLFGWAYVIGARLLYSFSRQGVGTLAHALWALGLCMLAIAMLSTPALAREVRRPARRWLVGSIIVAACAVLGFTRTLLDHTPHALRLVLYERTSFAYRLLFALPHRDVTVDDLEQGCPVLPTSVHSAPAAAEAASTIRGVVVIMVDALRGDRVPSEHAPRLTAFAARNYRFDRAYTPAPVTRQAIEAMMTGASSLTLPADRPPTAVIPAALSAAHISTIALTSSRYLEPWMRNFDINEQLASEQAKANNELLGSRIAFERARDQLDRIELGSRFFLFVHYYDPHAYYVANPLFAGGASLESRYDAEVAYTDHYIGRLLDHIDARGDTGHVAVLVVGDHGEEHWEHRYRWHRARVYEESVHIPLVLRIPDARGGAAIDRLVSISDVAPTILDLFGLPVPANLDGISLLSTLRNRRDEPARALFLASDIYPTYAIVRGDHKVIANLHTGVLEHYDLTRDPDEQDNLADQSTPVFDDLRCRLAHHLRRVESLALVPASP